MFNIKKIANLRTLKWFIFEDNKLWLLKILLKMKKTVQCSVSNKSYIVRSDPHQILTDVQ
jgi:hypothetical protein